MGTPFSMVVIGVDGLTDSVQFYQDVMGLDVLWQDSLKGPGFTDFWKLDAGMEADAALLGLDAEEFGRILLVDCKADNKVMIRPSDTKSILGLYNLNFHVDDCFAVVDVLRKQGIEFWSEPVKPDLDEEQGGTIEALFDGPAGVAINLVQLIGGRPDNSIGQLREQLSNHAQSRTGFTPVATSTLAPKDGDPAVAFFKDTLGMFPAIDQVLGNPATNAMLGRPEDAQNRIVFLAPGHVFGKILLSQPVNYEVNDAVGRSHLPNIGYLAQSYVVDDLNDVCAQAKALGGEIKTEPMNIDVPGLGKRQCALITCPGSGVLIQLIAA